jgi:hypothetical protein
MNTSHPKLTYCGYEQGTGEIIQYPVDGTPRGPFPGPP